MNPRFAISILLAAALSLCAGCKEGPFAPSVTQQAKPANVFPQPQSPVIASQVQDLNRRVGQLDVNNADLHRQLAQAEQARQTSQEQVTLLQRQLGEMATRLKDTQLAKVESDRQVSAIQASTRARGGATITAFDAFTWGTGGFAPVNSHVLLSSQPTMATAWFGFDLLSSG